MYDIAIIGTGPAGISCAKYAAKCGVTTILFDYDRDRFGGTWLNRGCIPTKFFITNAKHTPDWNTLSPANKDLIEKIKNPLLAFLAQQKVEMKWGRVAFKNAHTLTVNGETITAKNIIIATGSSPKPLLRHPKAISAEQLFSCATLPDTILIVGAGYIGIEIASLLNTFGKKVVVI